VKVGAYSAAAGYRTGRLLGYRRIVMLALGVAVGLLVAPVPGRELRERILDRLAGSRPMGELPPAGGTSEPAPDVTE
jgi:hypothetical protein